MSRDLAPAKQCSSLVRPLTTIARDINAEHLLARAAMQSALEHARRCGELLTEVKDRLPHGEFLPWLALNFEGSTRTAQLYMTLARQWPHFVANAQRAAPLDGFEDLSIRGALALLKAADGADDGDALAETSETPLPPVFVQTMTAIADLKPHPRRYKSHPDEQLDHLAHSIRTHGFYQPVVVARDYTILAGHGVVQAAERLSISEVPVVRLDLDPGETRALKIMIGDNELRKFAKTDDRRLCDLLRIIKPSDPLLGTGYNDVRLACATEFLRYMEAYAAAVRDGATHAQAHERGTAALREPQPPRAAFVEPES